MSATNAFKDYTDLEFLAHMLEGVSRTFALTIPQLPNKLYLPVATAYLLCRIVDTIEDDPALTPDEKEHFSELFNRTLIDPSLSEEFQNTLGPKLSNSTIPAEHELIACAGRVVDITNALPKAQIQPLLRCVKIMSSGMCYFQYNNNFSGLKDVEELEHYCYYVAGVVGEMLTSLFSDYSNEIQQYDPKLQKLAVSFGQGLQMTNILKDFWDDQERSACWFPEDVFNKHGGSLKDIDNTRENHAFEKGLNELIGIAHGHLLLALDYVLLIPSHEKGIRKFCLWALGMAILSLKKLNDNPNYDSGKQVKITRNAVKATIVTTNLFASNNFALKQLFKFASRGLPLSPVSPPDINHNTDIANKLQAT